MSDGSLRNGAEFVTPVLKWENIELLQAVIRAIRQGSERLLSFLKEDKNDVFFDLAVYPDRIELQHEYDITRKGTFGAVSRLIKAFDKAELLEKMTYGKVMGVLKRAKKTRLPEEEWKLVRLNPSHEEMLRKLELLPQMEAQPRRKRGRPRKK